MRTLITVFVTLLAFLLLIPANASAYTLLEDGDRKLSLGGLARLGWVFEADDEDFDQGPFFQYARLMGSIENKWGKGYVRAEGKSGNFELIDVYVLLKPLEVLHLKAGIYRRPTTAEYIRGARKIPFVRRSLLRNLNEERLPGVEAISTIPIGTMDLNLRLGWFVPEPQEIALLPDGDGNYISGRVALNFESGLGFHLSYFQLVLADNELVAAPEDPMGALVQPVPYPQTIDFAVMYMTKKWDLQAEVLLSPNSEDAIDELNWGAYAFSMYRIPIFNEMEIGPGARYGILNDQGVTTHRVTTGATLFIDDHYLKFIPNYDLAFTDGEVSHTVWLTWHGGF